MQRSTSLDSCNRQKWAPGTSPNFMCAASEKYVNKAADSTIPMRTEETKCNDNDGDEITSTPVPNSLSGSSNMDLTRTEGSNSRPNSITSSAITNNEKDFVESIDTCLRTILIPVYIFSCGLAITAYTKQMLSRTLVQVIVGGMPISFITVGVLACLSSSFKNSNSPIDDAAFRIFQWLLLPVMLFPTTLFWMSLHFAVKMSIFFVCPLGSISDLAILFVWYWYIYSGWKKITRDNNEDTVEEGGMSSLSHYTGYIYAIRVR